MNNSVITHTISKSLMLVGLTLLLTACGNMLPRATQETKTPWNSYADAEAMYAKIIPHKTTVADLKALGVSPGETPNVGVLSHADLLRRLVASSALDIRLLAPSIQGCIAAYQTCYGYEIEQTNVNRKRYGNFFMDFLNFHKQTDVSGWQFDAVIVINDNMVIYKQWSGKPKTHQLEEERNPLGPLQGIGPSIIYR